MPVFNPNTLSLYSQGLAHVIADWVSTHQQSNVSSCGVA